MKNLWCAFRTLIHIVVLMGVGFYALAFSLRVNNILKPIEFLYDNPRGRIIAMVIGILLILTSLILIFAHSKASLKDSKTISFDNPSGKVKISLSAIEDFIRKVALQIPGIHDMKPHAIARKNKIVIETKVVIWGSENLLNISQKAQEAIQSYLQEILGGEEKIQINMHVVKVLQDASKLKTESVENPTE